MAASQTTTRKTRSTRKSPEAPTKARGGKPESTALVEQLTPKLTPATMKLIEQGTAQLRSIMELEASRTECFRALAATVVRLRRKFRNSSGKPDLRGTSQAYRDAVAGMYRDAGVPADSEAGIQSTLRNHIADELRRTLTKGQLAEAGLKVDATPAAGSSTSRQTAPPAPPEAAAVTAVAEAIAANPATGNHSAPEGFDVTLLPREFIVADLRNGNPDVAFLTTKALAILRHAQSVGVTEGTNLDEMQAALIEVQGVTAELMAMLSTEEHRRRVPVPEPSAA